jgi:hypothetical protein
MHTKALQFMEKPSEAKTNPLRCRRITSPINKKPSIAQRKLPMQTENLPHTYKKTGGKTPMHRETVHCTG